ncbi:MAG: F0F1 ATP synthase subunit B [Clostridiales bacterium]|nr:F0F1 ATP synthase subunit B [Clostridiales bacterium]
MPAGSILEFNTAFLIKSGIQWLNIIALTAVLVFLLYKPVKNFMAGRAERIAKDIESARKSNEKAREDRIHYERLIAGIEEEREEILNEAHRIAVERSDQILIAAREEARHLMAKAEDEIKTERENAADEIKRQIIELSALMASRFVEISIDRNVQEAYLDEVLENWREWS